jgi:hypothetical protein
LAIIPAVMQRCSARSNGRTKTLFFTAGPNDEEDGLFGRITAG